MIDLAPEKVSNRLSSLSGRWITRDRLLVLLSIAFQLALGIWFGHAYDTRIFMATGYLVGAGESPYTAQDLTAVLNNPAFKGMTSIGYPPPWPLLLGIIYRGFNALKTVAPFFDNLFVYNLEIKISIIAANIGLASAVAAILSKLGAGAAVQRKAWIFLLWSPFLFYFASAWGQFDSIVALLSLIALLLIHSGKTKASAVVLALAISLKPTALPILPVALIYLLRKSRREAVTYLLISLASGIVFCVSPFFLLGWDPGPIIRGWNAQFAVGGGMSPLSFFEAVKDTYTLPGMWWLVGFAWIPALCAGLYAINRSEPLWQAAPKREDLDLHDLLWMSVALILIFFLTRAWLSEPNIILLLPFILILTLTGDLKRWQLAAVWILPLVFTIFNTSPPQLLFLVAPGAMTDLLKWADTYRSARLLIRTALVIPWQIAGWWIVITCFRAIRSASTTLSSLTPPDRIPTFGPGHKWVDRGG